MVRVTCLSPTKSYSYCSLAFAHMQILTYNFRTAILLIGAINEQPYKANKEDLRTIHQKQKNGFKRAY